MYALFVLFIVNILQGTLHQPKWSILQQFDKVMLLSQGHVIYFGPTRAGVEYFQNLGFPIKQYQNPGDYFCTNQQKATTYIL